MNVTGLNKVDEIDKETVLNQDILDALKKFIGSEAFGNYLSEYVENTQHNIERMGMAIAAQDSDRVRHLVHRLKGSSGNIGALKLAWACEQMEAAIVEDSGRDTVREQFAALEQVFNDTRFAIAAYREKLSGSQPHVA